MTRPMRVGMSVVARGGSGSVVGAGGWAAADMNETGTQSQGRCQGKRSLTTAEELAVGVMLTQFAAPATTCRAGDMGFTSWPGRGRR
jgi:hypothetical protein